jgi:hypothetical protein
VVTTITTIMPGVTTTITATKSFDGLPVGGRLQRFWRIWELGGANPVIVSMLRWGLTLTFLNPPPLVRVPMVMESYRGNPLKHAALGESVRDLVDKHVLEEVIVECSPGFYGRLFLKEKPDGSWRKIIDLSGLNDYVKNKTFRMESALTVQSSMRQGMWATSIDLSDAYYHIPIHPSFRKYFRVALLGKVFQFRAMPMGLNVAARVFTKMTMELLKVVRQRGIVIHAYIDDWMVKGYSPEMVQEQTLEVVQMCQNWGFMVNLNKSELTPTQDIQYLGVQFDLNRGLALPPVKRLEDMETHIQSIIFKGGASARSWHSLLGKLGSIMRQVPLGALHRRPLQRWLMSQWSQVSQDWESWIPMENSLLETLDWWMNRQMTRRGVHLAPFLPDLVLFTDASQEGYGASLGHLEVSGLWEIEETNLHSNNLELLAVTRAVTAFRESLMNKQVLLCTDNTTTVACINHQGGTKSWSLTEAAVQLWGLLDQMGCRMVARHIPGKLNVWADNLSRRRQVIPSEWSVLEEALIPVWERWGRPGVDLFATHRNRKLGMFVSPFPHPDAWKINAFSFSWRGNLMYAFPPWVILGEVLQKIRDDGAEIILIAPTWPTRSWFPLLLQMSREDPIPLENRRDLLVQPLSGLYHPNLEVLNLQAWRLSGSL